MDVGSDESVYIKIIASGYMKQGSMKKPIARAVSRSAARLLLTHVFVLNKGRGPFQWHHNGLHEVAWPV